MQQKSVSLCSQNLWIPEAFDISRAGYPAFAVAAIGLGASTPERWVNFRQRGPMVALGSPKKISQRQGRFEFIQHEDSWIKQVSTYLDLSGFVVLMVLHWSESSDVEMDAV